MGPRIVCKTEIGLQPSSGLKKAVNCDYDDDECRYYELPTFESIIINSYNNLITGTSKYLNTYIYTWYDSETVNTLEIIPEIIPFREDRCSY